jgi:hypothetical protein
VRGSAGMRTSGTAATPYDNEDQIAGAALSVVQASGPDSM